MNMILLALCGILAFPNGSEKLSRPTHIVAVQANSTAASGTLKLQSVVSYKTASDTTVAETNVVTKTTPVEKRDAYVGTDLVHQGSSTAAWTVTPTVVTNVADGVTNVVSFKVHVLTDNDATIGTWTNVASRMVTRWERTYSQETNVTTRTVKSYVTHPFTNTVLDVTLSGGKYNSITNIYVPGGELIGSGTAITGDAKGAVYLFTDR